ncbi:uncharacterized protein BJ212DRAFT_1304400 [Suillus subaureus]|uniref:Uncharacterized protein n=1 Tax=Suillus subaureus TaxID=48587 RepID=A0A9P7DVG2_9AGAM|nr:uncharacterized protein BJ212DRAFT_1304400 [Suillus subaureus]KAG1804191.1 hypothetical protein BJ212DRAFT_1304400 [Suillus subaureus]
MTTPALHIQKNENLPEVSEFRDEEGKKTGPFTWHAGKYQCNVILRFLAAVNEVVDAQLPPRFTIQVKDDPKQLPEKQIENRRVNVEEMEVKTKESEMKKGKCKSKIMSNKVKGQES